MYRKAFIVTYTCIALVVANYLVEEQKPIGAFDDPPIPTCSSTLTPPLPSPSPPPGTTLSIKLANTYTDGGDTFAYVIGRDKDQNLAILNKDGKTWYYPGNPPPCNNPNPKACQCIVNLEPVLIPVPTGDTGTPLSIDRYLVSTRVFFSHGVNKLQFRLNWNATGPQVADPSYVDPTDVNWNVDWGFAEFAWDETNMNADVTFLDFVGAPVGITLQTPKETTYAKGTPPDAIDCTCKKLQCQQDKDGIKWTSLCVKDQDGNVIRALGGNHAKDQSFDDYFKNYVEYAWDYYKTNTLTINSYADWTAQVDENEMLVFTPDPNTNNTPGSFSIPDSGNIFGCAGGAFEVNGPDARVRTIPILCAAINRATLLLPGGNQQPNGITDIGDYYYKNKTCNHFSRIVHEVEIDKLGYAFPYDEVKPGESQDQQGKVEVDSELVGSSLLTITVGGISDSPGCAADKICSTP